MTSSLMMMAVIVPVILGFNKPPQDAVAQYNSLVMLTDSGVQDFGEGAVGVAWLRSMIFGASAGKT